MSDMFRYADELGPSKIIHIYEPSLGLKAVVIVDNVAAGPAIGGMRMAPDVSVEECFRLARAMTLKNAAANLRHGGAKSVIAADPAMPPDHKERLIRAFATALRDIKDYIPGPDMGTNEQAMAWVYDETGRAVGLPRVLGGIPLDEIGATGFGVAIAAEAAQEFANINLKGARVAVQGFGAVGQHAATFLAERGAMLVAASDARGMIHCKDGLSVAELKRHKAEGGSLMDYGRGSSMGRDEIIGIDCDVWIPAARPDAIRKDNVGQLKAKLILQGANIPATLEAEMILHERGIISVPDFIANAGGVVCAAVEYRGGSEATAFEQIEEKIRHNTRECLLEANAKNVTPRQAASQIAKRRVQAAMKLRRWH